MFFHVVWSFCSNESPPHYSSSSDCVALPPPRDRDARFRSQLPVCVCVCAILVCPLLTCVRGDRGEGSHWRENTNKKQNINPLCNKTDGYLSMIIIQRKNLDDDLFFNIFLIDLFCYNIVRSHASCFFSVVFFFCQYGKNTCLQSCEQMNIEYSCSKGEA